MSTFSKGLPIFRNDVLVEVFSFHISAAFLSPLEIEQSLSLLYQDTLTAFSQGVHIHKF